MNAYTLKGLMAQALAPLKRMPMLYRTLQLAVVASLYAGIIYLVHLATPNNRIPDILVAVYFLPALLRAWTELYIEVKKDLVVLYEVSRRLMFKRDDSQQV